MKNWRVWIPTVMIAALLLSGCATSTIESRKQERYSAFGNLLPEQKAAVDSGQIKVGMTMDAVYIAWGKPNQVVTAESARGTTVTWLYTGSYLQGYTFWSHPGYFGPYDRFHGPGWYGPSFQHEYMPVNYVRAEVVFENGVVKEWRTLPSPGR
jgi:outer membrane protein assembly factor BamE (lipoprotein component of BamABCDE complex)